METLLIGALIFFLALIFSILGLGGALIYVPLFYYLAIPVPVLIPTALLLNGLTATSAATTYLRKHMVDLHIALPLSITSLIGAPVGAYFTQYIPLSTFLALLAIILLFAGTKMFLRVQPACSTSTSRLRILAGAGIGGGVFIVPLLIALGLCEPKRASATSALIVVFSSYSGLLGHLSLNSDLLTYPGAAILMLTTGIAAVLGGQAGAHIMHTRLQSRTINRMFGVVLLLVAAKIMVTYFFIKYTD